MNQGNTYGPRYPNYPYSNGTSSAVTVYRPPSEDAPLLPGKNKRPLTSTTSLFKFACLAVALVLFLFPVCQTGVHLVRCPPDPATRDAIRRDWEQEQAQHEAIERLWQHKQDVVERGWRRDAEQHAHEVAQRIKEELERQERVRRTFAREAEQHKREFEEMVHRERVQRELERQRWQREVNERKRHEEEERQRWQREVNERERREEEERQRHRMYWGNVEAHKCTTFETREYTAQLMNLPLSWEHRVEACKATPLEIHGISHLPKTCDDRGPGVVIGTWEISQQEPDCRTFWDLYNDKGCTSPGSKKKYVTYKLENLPDGGDWREFCATTPIQFDDIRFPGAQACFPSVWGIFGQWEVEDSNC